MSREVIVVGAGAAGLTAAIRAAESRARVRLLNAHPRIGLKILMSGGTRCNVTHREVSERDFNGGSRHVIARVLRAFPADATRAWFESLGVTLKLEETGKYFPVTDNAQTVLDALLMECGRLGVAIEHGARVVRLERSGSRWRLGVQQVRDSAAFGSGAVAAHGRTSWPSPVVEIERWIEADAAILACGGLSFPRTGSDGTGYALAQSVGHTLVPPVPALTPLTSDDPWRAKLQGITAEAELSLWIEGRREARISGSLLITHVGFSGPAALDLSRHWLRAEAGGSDRRVTASFMPGATTDMILRAWVEESRVSPRDSVKRRLALRVPERLAAELCVEGGIDPATPLAQIPRETRSRLAMLLVERDLHVTGTLGYEKAEATAGGVDLAEVDPSTLESRKAPGVFLCGEMLDVDGRLGGFNFQFAWSSGAVAGRAAGRRSDDGLRAKPS